MMIMSPQLWIVLRALVMLLVSWGIASYDTSKSNIDWVASLIVSEDMFAYLPLGWFDDRESGCAVLAREKLIASCFFGGVTQEN